MLTSNQFYKLAWTQETVESIKSQASKTISTHMY